MKTTRLYEGFFRYRLYLLTTGCLTLFAVITGSLPAANQQVQTPNLTTLLHRADSLLVRRKNTEAQKLYREVLQVDPQNSAAHAGLGWTLYDTGNHNLGLSEEQGALALDHNNALAHHYLASMYLAAGKDQEAADEFRLEYKIAPKRRCHCGPIERLLKNYPPRKLHSLNSKIVLPEDSRQDKSPSFKPSSL